MLTRKPRIVKQIKIKYLFGYSLYNDGSALSKMFINNLSLDSSILANSCLDVNSAIAFACTAREDSLSILDKSF